MRKNLVFAFLLLSIVLVSCDQDYNTVGADLVGDEHYDFEEEVIEGNDLKAYSVKTEEIQTNNLHLNPLGFYNNPYFGQTRANFVTQVTLSTIQPKFGTNVQIENVKLYIPLFSKVETTNSDGSRTFKLDSVFGANPESKMKLSIYENGYYLNSFDANDQSQDARYYNDMNGLIDAQKRGADAGNNSVPGGARLNNSTDVSQNDQFYFNKNEIVVYRTKFNTTSGITEYTDANGVVLPPADQTNPAKWVVKERLAPGIYIDLNKEFFKKKVLDASSDNLFNNNIFREYFKGLYFQVEQIAGQDGAMALINFSGAKLNINYSSIVSPETMATSKTLQLNIGSNTISNTVSLQDYTYAGNYNTGLNNPANIFGNTTFGQNEKLYLKGGKGSVVYLEINQAKIDAMKGKGWLVNDAYLEFYVEKNDMGQVNQEEAERIYLFDATNQKPLFDFYYDTSTSVNSKNNKSVHGGIIVRDSNEKGEKYKIRITQHINNILNSSNTNINKNVKLGLCVTESIAIASNYYFKDAKLFDAGTADDISIFPLASVLSQQGTVLHGTHSSDPDKKLKLVIHFTKPN